jgi:hypothetical protein
LQYTGTDAGDDDRRVSRHLPSREHKHTAVGDGPDLGFGKILRQCNPCRRIGVINVASNDTRKPRLRCGNRLGTAIGTHHLIRSIGEAAEDPMHIGHVGEVFVD